VPWVRALLRGQKIYARADATGRLLEEGGRVEIRYKPNDGRKYGARADNLKVEPGEVLPDDACGPAEAVQKKQAAEGEAAAEGEKKRPARASTPEARKAAAKTAHEAAPEPEAGRVVAYADGACSGNPGPAGLGVVVIDGDRHVEISEYLGTATNNIGELKAILRALQEVPDDRPMTIFTDSQYSIGVLQKGWKAKANTELVAEVKEALKARKRTRLQYVPGHAGVSLNERADQLAREAVATRRSRRADVRKPVPVRAEQG
jgi:ribonuclease HI